MPTRRWSETEVAGVIDRLSENLVGALSGTSVKRRSKFRNQKQVGHDGVLYHSKLEARYANELLLQRKVGVVRWYIRQVPFLLPGGVTYRTDFLVVREDPDYIPPLPRIEVIDCKGYMTRESLNKMKQVKELYGITVLLYRKDGSLLPFDQ